MNLNKMGDDDARAMQKFPDPWICPYCLGLDFPAADAVIPREKVLEHARGHENVPGDITWKDLYNRLIVVGGV